MSCGFPDTIAFVDEPYTWRVPLASALTNGLVLGFGKCLVLVIIAMAEEGMPLTSTVILVTTGLTICVMQIVSPFVEVLANRVTSRAVTFTGAVITIVAFILASCFLNSATFLPLIGILLTTGFSLSFSPPLLIYSLCFHRLRTRAAGICFAGESLGCTLLPFLVTMLIDQYTVRGAMLILGGVFSHLLISSVVLPTVIQDRESGEIMLRQGNARQCSCLTRQPSRDDEPPLPRKLPRLFSHPLSSTTAAIVFYNGGIMLTNFSYFNQIASYPLLSNEKGISRGQLSWIVAIHGLVEFVSRIGFGLACDYLRGSQKLIAVAVGQVVLGGVAILLSLIPGNLPVLIFYVVSFGLCGGSIGALWTVIVSHLVGTANSGRGLGLFLMNNNLFTLFLLMTMGYLENAMGYSWVLRIGGLSAVGSAILEMAGVWREMRIRECREEQVNLNEEEEVTERERIMTVEC